MSWKLCVPVPKDSTTIDGSRRICFLIPQHVPVGLGPIPEPDPPVFTLPGVDDRTILNMQTLATIDRFAGELPGEMSHEILRSVAAHMHAIGHRLGEGVQLHRQTPRA